MDQPRILQLLTDGTVEVEGRISWGSNATLLAHVCAGDEELLAVYKPRRGERPLWDFRRGTLCNRERAAFLISDAFGWSIVPPTVLREGPLGYGSVQLFVDHDPNIHYFSLQGQPQYDEQLRQIVLFDWISNNADRKAGHVLLGEDGRLWAIDHGICFHSDYKLRSVIWEYAGQPLTPTHCRSLEQLQQRLQTETLHSELETLLSTTEIAAVERRINYLLRTEKFPEPGPGRHYPWPPV